MGNLNDQLRDHLAGKCKRLTREKSDVAERMAAMRSFDIDQLIDEVKSLDNPFSRPTLYRTVHDLLDAGLIQMSKE